MNTIRDVLDAFLKKDGQDCFPMITVFTRAGNEFSGTDLIG